MTNWLRRSGLPAFFLLYTVSLFGQDPNLNITRIQKFLPVSKNLQLAIDPSGKLSPDAASRLNFYFPGNHNYLLSRKYLGQPYFRISLYNPANEPRHFLFYPGKGINASYYVMDAGGKGIMALPASAPTYSLVMLNYIPVQEFVVEPLSARTFLIKPEIHYYNWDLLDPAIVKPTYLEEFAFRYLIHPKRPQMFVSAVLLGIILSMCMFVMVRYFRKKKREYMYYGLASVLFILYFVLDILSLFFFTPSFFVISPYVYHFLQITGFIFCILFISRFLDMKQTLPDIYKLFRVIIGIQVFFLLVDIPLAFSDKRLYMSLDALDGVQIFLLCCSLYVVVVLYSQENRLAGYVATGTTCLLVLGALSLYHTKMQQFGSPLFGVKGTQDLLLMIGLVLEFLFFMSGILYKEKMEEMEQMKSIEQLRLEQERNEMEKLKAVLEARDAERSRISREMHDDIGAGLTSIRLLSEITRNGKAENSLENTVKISAIANMLVDRMNEIIWTMNPKNDSLGNLLAYLRHLVLEFFEPFDINVHFRMPDEVPDIEVNGSIRRNILLTVKEAIHNVAKHSGASQVEIEFMAGNNLEILIRDNGSGFDVNHLKTHRNGIRNMHERIQTIGGQLSISNGDGTSVFLRVPIS